MGVVLIENKLAKIVTGETEFFLSMLLEFVLVNIFATYVLFYFLIESFVSYTT